MSKGKKPYRPISEEELKQYQKGLLQGKSAHEIERRLLDDEFASEALEGWEQHDADDLSNDLIQLRGRLTGQRKKRVIWWQVAAVGALLFVSGFVLWSVSDQLAPEKDVAQELSKELKEPDSPVKSAEPVQKSAVEPPQENQEKSVQKATEQANTTTALSREALNDKGSAIAAEIEFYDVPEEAESFSEIADELSAEELIINENESNSTYDNIPEVDALAFEDVSLSADSPEVDLPIEELTGKLSGVSATQPSRAAEIKSLKKSNRKITGIVKTEEGEPLPGANVLVKGTNRGVITDLEGQFAMTVEPSDESLEVAFVGYEPEIVSIGDSLEVTLEADFTELSEVVVVGYGMAQKSNVTGAVTQVDMDEQHGSYEKPQPIGGKKAFKSYVEKNLKMPEAAIENEIKGTVKLQLSIDASGAIVTTEVKRGLGYGCDEEAIRLIREGPNWEPATRNGKAISSQVMIKIKFEL